MEIESHQLGTSRVLLLDVNTPLPLTYVTATLKIGPMFYKVPLEIQAFGLLWHLATPRAPSVGNNNRKEC
ncbi:hypothetical protein EDE15_1088 [Edaphobacter aggregans]|uniref:Uncharacterized protein n=1 Tax=Edaphobacter aggregans TaxID=570835 RepID=A0A3R9QFY7_9BACT|nr:hypothetical protein EDE15_1088 [Edaphobacter aggregans]